MFQMGWNHQLEFFRVNQCQIEPSLALQDGRIRGYNQDIFAWLREWLESLQLFGDYNGI